MTTTAMVSFESQDVAIEGVSAGAGVALFLAGAAFSTARARTGSVSMRANPVSGGSAFCGNLSNTARWCHFGFYVASLPTVDRQICGVAPGVGVTSVRLTSTGALTVYDNTTLIGTSTTTLETGRWYWIGVRYSAGTSVVFLQIDGVDQVTGTIATISNGMGRLGCSGSEASAIDVYYDDFIEDDAGFIPPSRVTTLIPTADNAVGTGWTLGTGTAISGNSGSTAVKNEPPLGVADLAAGSDPKQIRNATANANTNYDATMTTYAAGGITANDKVLAVVPIVSTAAPVTTSSKQGTIGVASNPTIANVALGAGGTAGAFWSGTAAGTYPTGWKASKGTLTASPTVTVGTAPVVRITQVTSSTRIAMVCFMGLVVAWTPGALGKIRSAQQAINRASAF